MTRLSAEPSPLPLAYRRAEVGRVAQALRAGDSCSVVGASGMGKSNLFRHLLDAGARRHFLGRDWRQYLLVPAYSHALTEISEAALFGHLHDSLRGELERGALARADAAGTAPRVWEQTPEPAAQAPQRGLFQAVRAALSAGDPRRIVFLLDQFDKVYATLGARAFTVLRALRDEHKYCVSYVVFTRAELPQLIGEPEGEEFYELFSSNVVHLGPYSRKDALLLLRRVGARYRRRLSPEVCERLIEATGGHPGTLKAACLAVLRGEAALAGGSQLTSEALLPVADVYGECLKLWGSLDPGERDLLRGSVAGRPAGGRDAEAARRLRAQRLVRDDGGREAPFSPLFAAFIAGLEAAGPAEIKLGVGPVSIDAAGEVWVEGRKVSPSLTPKEMRLLEYFCRKPGRLLTRDDIIAAVYPEVSSSGGTVSDEALGALVKRLRGRLQTSTDGPHYITTLRGKGYRFDVSD